MPALPGCIIFRICYEQRKSPMNLTGCVCLFWMQKLKHFLFKTHSWEQWVKASNVKHHCLEQFQCFLICQDCLQECHLTEKCLYLIYVFMSHFVQHCAQDWLWTSRSSWFFFSVYLVLPDTRIPTFYREKKHWIFKNSLHRQVEKKAYLFPQCVFSMKYVETEYKNTLFLIIFHKTWALFYSRC